MFAIRLDDSDLPKILADYLVLDFNNADNFTSDFFRLMHGIYQKPTHYEILHSVRNDTVDGGYLFKLWVNCELAFKKQIEFVEYRFDYEFDYEGYNSKFIEGAVHKATNSKGNYRVGELWTPESITVFVAIYLKNTNTVYFRKHIEVGVPVN
jgi:hypothetical protein